MLPRDWRLVLELVLQTFLDLSSALDSERERELELSRSCLILD